MSLKSQSTTNVVAASFKNFLKFNKNSEHLLRTSSGNNDSVFESSLTMVFTKEHRVHLSVSCVSLVMNIKITGKKYLALKNNFLYYKKRISEVKKKHNNLPSSSFTSFKKSFEFFGRKLIHLFFIVNNTAKSFFRKLPLNNFFFYCTSRHQPIYKASFLLALSPNTGSCLLVRCRILYTKHNQNNIFKSM